MKIHNQIIADFLVKNKLIHEWMVNASLNPILNTINNILEKNNERDYTKQKKLKELILTKILPPLVRHCYSNENEENEYNEDEENDAYYETPPDDLDGIIFDLVYEYKKMSKNVQKIKQKKAIVKKISPKKK